jgi:hypothetical protein
VILAFGLPAAQAASVIYASTPYGIYKSPDSGATWTYMNVNVSNSLLQGTPQPYAMAADPKNPMTVYFAGSVGNTNAFFRSTDGGQSWSAALLPNFPIASPHGSSLVIDPVATSNIYLVSGAHGVRSRNGGLTFTSLNLPTLHAEALTPDPTLPGVLLLTSPLHVSVDFGDTWVPLNPDASFAFSGFHTASVAVDPCNPQLLFVLNPGDFTKCLTANGSSFDCALAKSEDGGVSYKIINIAGGVHNLTFDRNTGAIYGGAYFASTGPSVIKSTDSGASFTTLYNTFVSEAPYVYLDPSASGTIFAFGLQTRVKGYVKSTDSGATWQAGTLPGLCNIAAQCPNTYASPEIFDLAFSAVPAALTNVSAADYLACPVAPSSIVSAFGAHLGNSLEQGQSPLPTVRGGSYSANCRIPPGASLPNQPRPG